MSFDQKKQKLVIHLKVYMTIIRLQSSTLKGEKPGFRVSSSVVPRPCWTSKSYTDLCQTVEAGVPSLSQKLGWEGDTGNSGKPMWLDTIPSLLGQAFLNESSQSVIKQLPGMDI